MKLVKQTTPRIRNTKCLSIPRTWKEGEEKQEMTKIRQTDTQSRSRSPLSLNLIPSLRALYTQPPPKIHLTIPPSITRSTPGDHAQRWNHKTGKENKKKKKSLIFHPSSLRLVRCHYSYPWLRHFAHRPNTTKVAARSLFVSVHIIYRNKGHHPWIPLRISLVFFPL